MRILAALALLILTSCPHTNGTIYAVRLNGCIDPQVMYARIHVGDMDFLEGAHFVMDDDAMATSASATATIFCGPTNPSGPGGIDLATGAIGIDPTMANGELAFTAVMLHELTHWQIARGPHPERAKVHICLSMTDLGDPALCYTANRDDHAVMLPSSPGLGSMTASPWDGSIETLSDADIPNFSFTLADQEFFAWATTP